jgi:hypothetical protein
VAGTGQFQRHLSGVGCPFVEQGMDIDALVARVPGASPRTDGPPASYAWEPQLRDLERAVRETPEVPALSPRWAGLAHRKQQDEQVSRHRTVTRNLGERVPS